MRQQGEPSVEEILESIKRVIARDNRETALAERRQRESAGVEALATTDDEASDEEVFDLGEAVIEAVDEFAIHRVQLVGPVHGQQCDAVGNLFGQDGIGGLGRHRPFYQDGRTP